MKEVEFSEVLVEYASQLEALKSFYHQRVEPQLVIEGVEDALQGVDEELARTKVLCQREIVLRIQHSISKALDGMVSPDSVNVVPTDKANTFVVSYSALPASRFLFDQDPVVAKALDTVVEEEWAPQEFIERYFDTYISMDPRRAGEFTESASSELLDDLISRAKIIKAYVLQNAFALNAETPYCGLTKGEIVDQFTVPSRPAGALVLRYMMDTVIILGEAGGDTYVFAEYSPLGTNKLHKVGYFRSERRDIVLQHFKDYVFAKSRLFPDEPERYEPIEIFLADREDNSW